MKLETSVGIFILVAIGLFLYLSINIRAIRFDKDQYHTYRAYFDDTSGLALKSMVKVAGVEIGWVEQIELLEDGKAEVVMRINKNIRLAKNAYAMIHQDGLIGTKNLEIDPGDPSTGFLAPGSVLSMPGRAPASVNELLDQFRDIANTIQDITSSFKTVFASRKGEDNMRQALNSITQASQRIADFSLVLQRTMNKNEENINVIVADLRTTMDQFKTRVPDAICDNAKRAGDAFEHFGDASIQGRETLREAGEVVEKVNSGKGVLGKLVNEEETYTDIKKTIRGFRDYVGKTQALMLNVDMHGETIFRHTNSKGYFELDLRPSSDFFYRLQLVGSENGSFKRQFINRIWKDDKGNVLRPSELPIPLARKIEYAENRERTIQTKYDVLFGLQFGKRFDRLAFRLGLFEGTFGLGLDYYVPLQTDYIHWITTLEAFDFRGTQRWNDTRPHVKWLNKVYFLKNLYTSFGVDDIYCKQGGNPFFGGGFRFGDDDLKYFLSYLPSKAAGR